MRIVAALHRREKIKRLSLEKILDLLLVKTKSMKEIAIKRVKNRNLLLV